MMSFNMMTPMGYWGGSGGPFGWNSGGVFGPMDGFGIFAGIFFGLFMLALVIWTIYWKYQAIWYAVKHDHKWWFIAFLVINTVGILEILYLYIFSKKMDIPAGQPHDENRTPMVPTRQG